VIQVFKCPSCGASLSYEGGSAPTTTCQFCGATVEVPEVTGLDLATARSTLRAAGFKVTVTFIDTEAPSLQVFDLTKLGGPPAGQIGGGPGARPSRGAGRR